MTLLCFVFIYMIIELHFRMAVGARTGRRCISKSSATVSGQKRLLLLNSSNRWWQHCLKQLWLNRQLLF